MSDTLSDEQVEAATEVAAIDASELDPATADADAVVEEAEKVVEEAAARLNPYDLTGADVSDETDLDDILAAGGASFDALRLIPTIKVAGPNGTTIDQEVDAVAIVRDDDNTVLGVHKGGYEMVQYRDVAEIALEVVGLAPSDNAVKHCGVVGDGRQFFVNIELPELRIDPSGIDDVIKRYLTGFGSHDGTLGIMFVPEFLRYACTNMAPGVRAKARQFGFTAKHTKNVLEKLKLAEQALGMADEAAVEFVTQAETMLSLPMTKGGIEKLVGKLWGAAPDSSASDRAKTTYATRLGRVTTFYKNEREQVGHNAWAAYNAVTEYLDHGRGTTADKRAIATISPTGHVNKRKVAAAQILLAG